MHVARGRKIGLANYSLGVQTPRLFSATSWGLCRQSSGNFRKSGWGPFQIFSGNLRQFRVILGNLGGPKAQEKPIEGREICVPVPGPTKKMEVRMKVLIFPGKSWGVAKGSSISWVAKLKVDKESECKLSNGRSRSYKVIKRLLSAGK